VRGEKRASVEIAAGIAGEGASGGERRERREDGGWGMEDGGWKMEDGRQKAKGGISAVEGGRRMAQGKWLMDG
jgi:hypothetical protein